MLENKLENKLEWKNYFEKHDANLRKNKLHKNLNSLKKRVNPKILPFH